MITLAPSTLLLRLDRSWFFLCRCQHINCESLMIAKTRREPDDGIAGRRIAGGTRESDQPGLRIRGSAAGGYSCTGRTLLASRTRGTCVYRAGNVVAAPSRAIWTNGRASTQFSCSIVYIRSCHTHAHIHLLDRYTHVHTPTQSPHTHVTKRSQHTQI